MPGLIGVQTAQALEGFQRVGPKILLFRFGPLILRVVFHIIGSFFPGLVGIVSFRALEILSVSGSKIFVVSNVFGTAGLVPQGSAPSRSSVVVSSRGWSDTVDQQTCQRRALPKAGQNAVAHSRYVGWPLGMLREYSLLGVDAVNQRRPTD
jgi:hypothetical protein